MEEIKIVGETNNVESVELDVFTFKSSNTPVFKMKKVEARKRAKQQRIRKEIEARNKKIKNIKLFGKVVALSLLCVASGKAYELVDNKLLEHKEEEAMKDYSSSINQNIRSNMYYLPDQGIVDVNKYAYHYDKIAKYIDDKEKEVESITYQNKNVEVKDFYIASAVSFFEKNYGNVDGIVNYMASTGSSRTLDEYVKTLGYSTKEDYVDSMYQINYELKEDNVSFEKVKTLK